MTRKPTGGRGSNQYATKGVSASSAVQPRSSAAVGVDADPEEVAWVFSPERGVWVEEADVHTVADVRAWQAIGCTTAQKAASWTIMGLTPGQAQLFMEGGFDAGDAWGWIDLFADGQTGSGIAGDGLAELASHGFDPEYTKRLLNMDLSVPDLAQEWHDCGFDPTERRLWAPVIHDAHAAAEWVAAGCEKWDIPDYLDEYIEQGISPSEGASWVCHGYSVDDRQPWLDVGVFDGQEAQGWERFGYDAGRARKFVLHGIHQPPEDNGL